MEQISIEDALATQTLPFQSSQGRGWGVQCKVIKRDGVRCRRWAISGGYVCPKHGGQLAVVRRAAEARKRDLAFRAICVLWESMDPDVNPAVRLRAAKYALRLCDITPGRTRTSRHAQDEQRAIEAPKKGIDAEIEAVLSRLREIEA